VNISDKAKEVIKRKVDEFNTIRILQGTEDEMLEYMIMEFDASTAVEKLELFKKRIQNRLEFISSINSLPTESNDVIELINKAYTTGWKQGWLDFQWRKKSCQYLRREE